ncbi:integrase core domain-containing protein [Rhodobacter sp. JA431]|uniref:integrase core domain-containing protein n=1 Tax=Rhodobacter sp. JA431 TaxID=570013 RepID=UPI000BE42F23
MAPSSPRTRSCDGLSRCRWSGTTSRLAVARWTHIYNTERPHSALGYQAPAVFAGQLNAMGDQLRTTELLRRSPIAPSAQPRQIQQRLCFQPDGHRESRMCHNRRVPRADGLFDF